MTGPALAPGTKLGPYEIVAPLGAGGMGEVYRARDSRLGRDVAVKVLPQHLSANAETRARFEREARTVSSLNHPHICTIHDVGRAGDTDFLVLELVEGETLAARLVRGPLPAGDVLRVGAQIADALDRAHRAGVIHRDLKPANVMLTKSGAKLLDFGLARATGLAPAPPGSSGATLPPSPTIAGPLTAEGTIVGTFQYMSPEQLEGREADARSDLWALGCVLYEMATGRRAFDGATQASMISAIMRDTPRPMAELAPLSPPALERLVLALLAKDPDERIQTAHDAKLQLQWAGEGGSSAGARLPAPTVARGGRPPMAVVVAALAIAMAAAAWLLPLGRRFDGAAPRTRLTVQAPAGIAIADAGNAAAISPDGRTLAFVGTDSSETSRLWLRDLGDLEARPLEGTDHAFQPFWSPDSRWIGYFADGKLKKVAAAGGRPEALCDAPDPRGATWGAGGMIVFAPSATGGLWSVPADGGAATLLLAPDSTRGETALRFPSFLPDGKRFLFAALPERDGQFDIGVAEVGGRTRRIVQRAEAAPIYAAPGYLVTIQGPRLIALPFDARGARVTGKPKVLGPVPVGGVNDAQPAATASRTGILAYTTTTIANTRLLWLDRSGRPVGTLGAPPATWIVSPMSPDGRSVLLVRASSLKASDFWRVDTSTGEAARCTFDPTHTQGIAIWSPDAKRIAYNSSLEGPSTVMIQPVDGGTPERAFKSGALFLNPASWAPDGRSLVFYQPAGRLGWDVWLLPLDPAGPARPLLQTPANEVGGWISRDGRWIAYASDASGQSDLYVQSFPEATTRVRVSGSTSSGGIGVAWWSRDGRELAFTAGNEMRVVEIAPGSPLRLGPTRTLFRLPEANAGITPMPDHDRFLIAVGERANTIPSVLIDMNWATEARRQ